MMIKNSWVALLMSVVIVYLPSIGSFILSVPPQGIFFTAKWHALFLIPSIIVGTGSVLLMRALHRNSRLRRAGYAGLIGFALSVIVCLAECGVVAPPGEPPIWYAIPLTPIVLFGTVGTALIASMTDLIKEPKEPSGTKGSA
jgi:hypothetical protein